MPSLPGPLTILNNCCKYIYRKFHVDVCFVFLVGYVGVDLQDHTITVLYHLSMNFPVFKEAMHCCTLIVYSLHMFLTVSYKENVILLQQKHEGVLRCLPD